MTPNEKEVLKEFEKVPKASAIGMGKKLAIPDIDYCQNLCMSLVRQGWLVVVEGGKWPVFALARELSKDENEVLDSNSVKGEEVEDDG